MSILKKIGMAKFLFCYFCKFVEIFPKKSDIHIIIPRYESLVSDSSQQRTIYKEIFQPIFLTYTVKFM